jgi:hypothetical protein
MSLKAFHLIFIIASIALTLGCGIWELKNFFSADGHWLDLVVALAALAGAGGLILYERYFLKKLKNVSYL